MSAETDLPLHGRNGTSGKPRGIFYGWWIVAAGTVVQGINAAVYYYGMAVFFTPLVQEFGWSRTALSGAFSIARLEAGIAGPVAGICIDRWGPRSMMLFGITLMSVGFVLLSFIQTLEAFYLVFLLFLSVGVGFGVGPPLATAVANWFIRRRAIAMAVLMCGAGVGGFLASSLGWLINTFGWRTSFVIIGCVVLLTSLPAILALRPRPEACGLRPDGDPPSAKAGTAPVAGRREQA